MKWREWEQERRQAGSKDENGKEKMRERKNMGGKMERICEC